ncbi:anti-sigma factor domain-containing protein [Cryobacterium sp. PAMC25264]|uniref:anti-sigma factor domain-containing protein n=1 Tax=Cryobacterium sp. PAMC25264 TaxID=2861288 RepID=UPI001C62504C|nr:anti-sigma factor [Cryobacterium sp. PAMC25264]QYF73771.1 anti-sigma factor [Cryobacterium sp. PAMC25264]
MTHLDRDTLALVALAELELSPQERAHLADCPGCTGELDALRHTVLIGRSAGSVDLVEPADAVWGRIHAALGLSEGVVGVPRLADPQGAAAAEEFVADSAAVRPEGPVAAETTEVGPRGESDEVPRAPAAPNVPGHTGAGVPGAGPDDVPGGPARLPASVADLGRRRRRWLPLAAAACAVGLVGGIAAGAWWQATRSPAPVPVIAEAQLDALPGWTASGSAAVEESADGERDVVVDLTGGDDSAGLREVWLLTADATGLVSVGLLDGSSGRFAIPADIDLSQYPVVDVSAEPDDGNPAHSGDSIVRGTLHGL